MIERLRERERERGSAFWLKPAKRSFRCFSPKANLESSRISAVFVGPKRKSLRGRQSSSPIFLALAATKTSSARPQ